MAISNFEYTRYNFVEPSVISESDYQFIKRNSNKVKSILFPINYSWVDFFSIYAKMLLIGGAGGATSFIIGGSFGDGWHVPIFMIAGFILIMMFFWTIVRMIIELPSFSSYQIKKLNYKTKVLNAMRITNDYSSFLKHLYKV